MTLQVVLFLTLRFHRTKILHCGFLILVVAIQLSGEHMINIYFGPKGEKNNRELLSPKSLRLKL